MVASELFFSMLAFALADWTASWRAWHKVRLITKPGTLILLIAWFSLAGGWQGTLAWFGLGLVFSLAGDIFLMGSERFFLPGMAAFFLAHASYISGFMQEDLAPRWTIVIPITIVVAIYLYYRRLIVAGMRASRQMEMNLPITIYALILALMLLAATSTLYRPAWQPGLASLASLGAALFFFSDAVIGYNRFLRPVPFNDLLVMLTYHLGQILIITAVLFQYAL